ncbi:Thymidylate synthase ThyX [Brevinematales bacterium NS]|nr:FAD-dependent thymidylate synthase [Brevinematales bacterium]QJR22225.1 Thymidylate synthase ThyX [Brevinematales bacterium NS]
MTITLLQYTPDPEKLIEYSARVCYLSQEKMSPTSHEKFLPGLLKNGHLSVFEHASATFFIEGISRACSHQLVRHRLASFSQQSQRYVEEKGFLYVTPPEIEKNPKALEVYENTMKSLQEAYEKLVSLGIKREDARFLLPNATHTTLSMTANFREWLHIIDMRVSPHAQWEIRELLTLIWKELYAIAPVVFGLTYFENWSKDIDFKREVFSQRIAL